MPTRSSRACAAQVGARARETRANRKPHAVVRADNRKAESQSSCRMSFTASRKRKGLSLQDVLFEFVIIAGLFNLVR